MKAVYSKKGNNGKDLFEIKEVQVPDLKSDEFLIQTKAISLNPTDYKHALMAPGFLAGTDASGVVVRKGESVTDFEVGDAVATWDHGGLKEFRGKFAEYVIGHKDNSIKITNKLSEKHWNGTISSGPIDSFEAASTLPLGLATTGVSFHYNLEIDPASSNNKHSYILIWSGATATGVVAIQVARKIYRLKVIATGSPKNFELLKALGAEAVFDHYSEDVAEQIRAYGKGGIKYALDTVGTDQSWQSTYDATIGSDTKAIDNIVHKTPETLSYDSTRNIKFGRTVVYLALGDSFMGQGPSQQLTDRYRDFWYNLLPPHIDSFLTANIKLLPGFETINEGINLLRENKVSGTKVTHYLGK